MDDESLTPEDREAAVRLGHIDPRPEVEQQAAAIGAASPRELAFRTGQPTLPVEPGWKHALVPGRPRGRPWLQTSRRITGGKRN